MKRVDRQGAGRRAARDAAGARRQHRPERARAGEGVRRRARPHRPGRHQARRHRQGRRDLRHRARSARCRCCFIGVGEGIDDLRPFAAREFVEALLGELLRRRQALSRRPGGAEGRQLRARGGRDGLPHRPLRRRQVHAAQADRGDRAADLGHGGRQRPERRRAQARRDSVPAAQPRAGVPGPEAALRPQRVRQRGAAARLRGLSRRARRRGACARRSTRWAWPAREKANPVPLSGGEQQRLVHRARDREPARGADRRRADRQPRRRSCGARCSTSSSPSTRSASRC